MKHVFTVRKADASAVTAKIEITDAQAAADKRFEDGLRMLAQHHREGTIATFSESNVFGYVTRAYVIDYAQIKEDGATN